jgi:hypothetical protein
MAARSLQTWAVGFGSVVRLVALTVLPPMSFPALARVPSWAQLIWAAPPPTVPELTKNVALAACGCSACW